MIKQNTHTRVARIYEADFRILEDEIISKSIHEVIIYGAGENGKNFLNFFRQKGINVKYMVDRIAEDEQYKLKGVMVFSKKKLEDDYDGEIVVISPNLYEGIWDSCLKIGIPAEKLILPFVLQEETVIDLGIQITECSMDIDYAGHKPSAPGATVITITYNTPPHFIRRAIECVLRQTYRDFEYVIIDNGATDKTTAEIISEYAKLDARITVITKEKNLVWSDNRMIDDCLNAIKGDYVTILESDDYFEKTFLQKTLSTAVENTADVVQVKNLVYSEVDAFDYYLNYKRPSMKLVGRSIVTMYVALAQLTMVLWGTVFSSKCFKDFLERMRTKTEQEKNFQLGSDLGWMYEILRYVNKAVVYDEILNFHTERTSNTSQSKGSPNWLLTIYYVYENMRRDFLLWYGKDEEYSEKFAISHFWWHVRRPQALDTFLDMKEKNYAVSQLKKMIKDPLLKRYFKLTKKNKAYFYKLKQTLRELQRVNR